MDLTSGFPLENPAIFVPSRVKVFFCRQPVR